MLGVEKSRLAKGILAVLERWFRSCWPDGELDVIGTF